MARSHVIRQIIPMLLILSAAAAGACLSREQSMKRTQERFERRMQEMIDLHPQFSQGETLQQQLPLPATPEPTPAQTLILQGTSESEENPKLQKIKEAPETKEPTQPSPSLESISEPETTAAEAKSTVPMHDPDSEPYRLCEVPENPPPQIARHQVHLKTPYKPGEKAVYDVSYLGVLAGHGTIEVDTPVLLDGVWHQALRAEVTSGEWYHYIYVVRDKIVAWSRPWDLALRRFYMEQDEGKMMGKRFVSKKWSDFDHKNCKVHEKIQDKDKAERQVEFDLHRGASDVLGAVFHLRSLDYKLGEKQSIPVFTSEKNWSLEANPIAHETVKVMDKSFEAVRLKLQTYIGGELQQKGNVHIWFARHSLGRVLLQVKAEVKVGSFWMKLKEFHQGQAH